MTTKNRTIHGLMFQSETVAALTYRQRWLWAGLIATADGQGRGRARGALVRASVFPLDELAASEVDADLSALHALGMIQLYQAEGRALWQIVNWWRYQNPQWVGPSDYAPPEGWLDRLRYNGKAHKVVTRNWPGTPDSVPETTPEGDDADTDTELDTSSKKIEDRDRDRERPLNRGLNRGLNKAITPADAHALFHIFSDTWNTYFPAKPMPPGTDNKPLVGRFEALVATTDFREKWQDALRNAVAVGSWLPGKGFFTPSWFLDPTDSNGDGANWQKLLNGNYIDTPSDAPPPQTRIKAGSRPVGMDAFDQLEGQVALAYNPIVDEPARVANVVMGKDARRGDWKIHG